MDTRYILSVAILTFLSIFCLAQTPARQPNAELPTLTAETELVVVPAVVHDGDGRHMPGLGASDFVVLENGLRQVILSVEEVVARPTEPRSADFASATNLKSGSAPGDFSNTLQASVSGAVVILFDGRNPTFTEQGYARDQLLKVLPSLQSDGRPVMLVAVSGSGLRVIHGFTDDLAALAARAKRLQATTSAERMPGQDMPEPFIGLDDSFGEGRLRTTRDGNVQSVEALRAIADSLKGIPGRKALIWIGSGIMKVDPASFCSGHLSMADDRRITAFELAFREFNSANASIYTIDLSPPAIPGGISAAPATRGATPPRFIDLVNNSRYCGRDRVADMRSSDRAAFMREFADQTGGTACKNRAFENCLSQAMDDSARHYLLAYRPAKRGKPGWRSLSVRVLREGVTVRARAGYSTTSTTTAAVPQPDLLRAAMDLPVQQTALPFRVRASKGADGNKTQVQYAMAIQGLQIETAQRNRVHLDVNVTALNAEGAQVAFSSKTVDGRLNARGIQQVRVEGLPYTAILPVPPETALLIFAVRDNVSGRIGTIRAPLSAIPERQ